MHKGCHLDYVSHLSHGAGMSPLAQHQTPLRMPDWLAWAASLLLLQACGGAASSGATDASAVVSEGAPNAQDAATSSAAGDSSTDALGLEDGLTIDRCATSCPVSEPAVGDPCDFAQECEYGGSTFLSCNRVYECPLGHVTRTLVSDTSTCPTSLLPGCPSSLTMIIPGASCEASSVTTTLQCVYADSECDCIQGTGLNGTATWICSEPEAGAVRGCPVPRAMLGTPCPPNSPPGCQYLAPDLFEACSSCGSRWTTDIVP